MNSLASVEVQLIMHHLLAEERLQLALCSRQLLAAASSSFAWRHALLHIDSQRLRDCAFVACRFARMIPVEMRFSFVGADYKRRDALALLDSSLRPVQLFAESIGASVDSTWWVSALADPRLQGLTVVRMHEMSRVRVLSGVVFEALAALPALTDLTVTLATVVRARCPTKLRHLSTNTIGVVMALPSPELESLTLSPHSSNILVCSNLSAILSTLPQLQSLKLCGCVDVHTLLPALLDAASLRVLHIVLPEHVLPSSVRELALALSGILAAIPALTVTVTHKQEPSPPESVLRCDENELLAPFAEDIAGGRLTVHQTQSQPRPHVTVETFDQPMWDALAADPAVFLGAFPVLPSTALNGPD